MVTPWEPLSSAFDEKDDHNQKGKAVKNREYEELGGDFIQV